MFFVGLFEVNGSFSKKNHKITFLLVILFFWILSFVRWKTGTDWESYYNFFSNSDTYDEFVEKAFEPLYTYLGYIIKQFSSEYWFFLCIVGLLIFPLTSTTIYKYSTFPFVSLLVYLLLRRADIFFVRESIALAFCFYSIKFIRNRKFWKFLILVLIGFGFHNSTIVFLPAYYIYSLKIDIKKSILFVAIIGLFMIYIQGWLTSVVGDVASVLGDSFYDKTDKYIERGYDIYGASSVESTLVKGAINRIAMLLFFFLGFRKYYDDDHFKGMINIYLFSLLLFFLLAPLSLTLNRLCNSYEMIAILLIGYTFDSLSAKSRPLVFLLVYVYIVIRFCMGTLFGAYADEFVPFKTIF